MSETEKHSEKQTFALIIWQDFQVKLVLCSLSFSKMSQQQEDQERFSPQAISPIKFERDRERKAYFAARNLLRWLNGPNILNEGFFLRKPVI